MTTPEMAILDESEFFVDGQTGSDKMVRARKKSEITGRCEGAEFATLNLILRRVIPSERQSAEWYVGAFKDSFRVLRFPLSPDSKTKMRLLTVCMYTF